MLERLQPVQSLHVSSKAERANVNVPRQGFIVDDHGDELCRVCGGTAFNVNDLFLLPDAGHRHVGAVLCVLPSKPRGVGGCFHG